uniref:Uncharacterized protein n=1 Tax=Solanum tuberosum TaxID=4113 RepID=M1AG00_SOLTU
MMTQMEVLQEHRKGTCGVFRVEVGSSSGYSRPGENQGWNSKSESLNPSDELKEEAGPIPEWINGYNMNDEKIDVERTMPSPKLVNSSNKDEEKQIDGVKPVHSPEPVNRSNKDEEQQINGVKAISPEPVNGSNKDEWKQLDGEKIVCSPEPINSSSKPEQQIDGPDNDFVSILQGERFPLKAKVTEKESTGPEPIGDATDHQGLKLNDSPTMELGI